MKLRYWLITLLVVFSVIILIVYWEPEKKPEKIISKGPFPPGPNIRISASPFPPAPSPSVFSVTPAIQPEKTANPSATIQETTASQSAEQALSSSFRINVQDALGEPIKKGKISIQGKEHPFYGGLLLCDDTPKGNCELAVAADGYRSATGTIDLSKTNEYTITLEYTSTHGVTVYSDEKRNNPCSDADVYLWKGPAPPRPVDMQAAGFVERWESEDIRNITFARNNMGILAKSIQKKYKDHLFNGYPGGKFMPWTNDWISGVDLLNWDGRRYILKEEEIHYTRIIDPGSTHLRMWDVLSMAEKKDFTLWQFVMLRFLHKENEYFTYLRMPIRPEEKTLFRQGKTDRKGYCSFTGLPPGIYYAQACKKNTKSSILTFYPTRADGKLSLFDSASVVVKVEKTGGELFNSSIARTVPNVQVSLIPSITVETQGKGVYMGTADHYGWTNFKSVQWGAYQLKVQFPEEYSYPPVTKEIVIDKPHHCFIIPVEDKGVKVSGKVVRKDTYAGVENFPIELSAASNNLQCSNGAVKTDSEGNFYFDHIQPGKYSIHYFSQSEEKMDFIPYPSYFLYQSKGGGSQTESLYFEVADKNIEGLEYPVVPVVITRFNGTVVDQNNKPIPEAWVTLESRAGNFSDDIRPLGPQPAKTDGDGKFDLFIPSGATPQNKEFTFYLVATYVKVIPYSESNPGNNDVKDTIIPIAHGEIPITFHAGDQFENLKIGLNANLFTKRINGIVKTEDGGSFEGIEVLITQDGFDFNPAVAGDGTFTINGLKPGYAELNTSSPYTEVRLDRIGTKLINTYYNEYVQLQIPSDETPDLYMEITLKKAGYLAGMVVDKNGKPVKDARVQNHVVDGKGIWAGFTNPTAVDGMFFISNAPLNYAYNLTAMDEKGDVVLGELNGIQPNNVNIVIRCP